MEYRRLGNSGLVVSRICLGCMSFGVPDQGNQKWTIGEDETRAVIKAALDAGITFFDTANVYSAGSSEELVGRALRDYASRDDIVLATKVYNTMRPGPSGSGLSRKAIMAEVDNSLRRLGTDYIDLYQIHRFDKNTPIEETLEALHDLVKSGKVRYIGASSMYAWQFTKMLYTADLHGWTRFVSMQSHYNLLQREEEREMFPLCVDQGIGLIPWSPVARGRLTRPWDEKTNRSELDAFGRALYLDTDKVIVERVGEVATRLGVPMAQIALAWMLTKPGMTAPIIGVTKLPQLDDAIAAVALRLDEETVSYLEAPYEPHRITGFA